MSSRTRVKIAGLGVIMAGLGGGVTISNPTSTTGAIAGIIMTALGIALVFWGTSERK